MEEKIRIFLLHQEHFISKAEIFNLKPYITARQIKEIRLPLEMKKFRVNSEILHSCLYYVIGI